MCDEGHERAVDRDTVGTITIGARHNQPPGTATPRHRSDDAKNQLGLIHTACGCVVGGRIILALVRRQPMVDHVVCHRWRADATQHFVSTGKIPRSQQHEKWRERNPWLRHAYPVGAATSRSARLFARSSAKPVLAPFELKRPRMVGNGRDRDVASWCVRVLPMTDHQTWLK